MESGSISNSSYSTTPLKSEGNSSSTSRRHVYDRSSTNPYKTPVRCNVNQIVKGNLTKPNSYKTNVIETMPIYSPPTKSISFVKNPFEQARLLQERLSQPICSPSMFQNIVSPSQTDSFSWSIDDISVLRPAEIDENPSQDFDSWFSPATESQAQEAINKFFSSQVVSLESPLLTEAKKMIYNSESKSLDRPTTTETWSQTTLSFPPNLPSEVEAILSTYCTFTSNQWNQNEDELNCSNSSVSRKKLLFNDMNSTAINNDEDDAGSTCSTPHLIRSESFRRTDGTPVKSNLTSPELSPINSENNESPLGQDVSMQSRRSLLHFNITNDIEMAEKENTLPNNWDLKGCSTPMMPPNDCGNDSAFSSL